MKEQVITKVNSWISGKTTRVVTIPEEIRKRLGDPTVFIVKTDGKRIIYEPVGVDQ